MRKERQLTLGTGVFIAAALLYLGVIYHSPIDVDKIWQLYVARRFLAGAELYRDIVEANPPLIIYLLSIPAKIAQTFNISEWGSLKIFTILLAISSVSISGMVLKAHMYLGKYRLFTLLLLVYALLIVPDTVVTFGDREHLFIILTLPYLLSLLPGVERTKLSYGLRVIIALMAGVGFCIKPHCAILWFAAQAHQFSKHYFYDKKSFISSFSTTFFMLENALIYMCAIFYVAAVAWLHPDYFPIALPMALATYGTYHGPAFWRLFHFSEPAILLGCCLVSFSFKRRSYFTQDIPYILCLICGGAVYALLNQGWYYTYYPLNAYTVLLCGWMLLHHRDYLGELPAASPLVKKAKQGRNETKFALALSALFYVSGSISSAYQNIPDTIKAHIPAAISFNTEPDEGVSYKAWLQEVVDFYAPHKSYYMMSINFPGVMLLDSDAYSWPVRFYSLWMLRALFPEDNKTKTPFTQSDYTRESWVKNYVTRTIAEDLDAKKPDLVLVDTSPEHMSFGQRPLDMLRFFSTDPEFRKAWKHYWLVRVYDNNCATKKKPMDCRYEVWVRE